MKVLVVGWSSVRDGEATAGDVLAVRAVAQRCDAEGVAHDLAWSAVMARPGELRLADVEPAAYTHLVWVCGPLRGAPVQWVHERFAHCRRVAVGVSVISADDPEVTGFDVVIPRDGAGGAAQRDLAARPGVDLPPVVGVILASGQAEFGGRRRHDDVNAAMGEWLRGLDAARVVLDTRLDPRDWRLAARAEQVEGVLARMDVVVTTRLHGVVLALKHGVPVVAVDPVAGGAKVSAQAAAWGWPVLAAEEVGPQVLDRAFTWCRSEDGRRAASAAAASANDAGRDQLDELITALGRPSSR